MTETNVLAGKFEAKTGEVWTVSVRVGGNGAEHIGAACRCKRNDGSWATVTLGRLVEDYGDGDVAIFEVAK